MVFHDLKSKLNTETFNEEMIKVNESLDNKIDKGTVMTHEDFLDNENITIPDNDIINRLNTVEDNSKQFQQDLTINVETNLDDFRQELRLKANKSEVLYDEEFLVNENITIPDNDIINRLNTVESNSKQFEKDLDNKLETNLNLFRQELEKKADKVNVIMSEPFNGNESFEFEEDIIARLNRIEQNMITSLIV